MDAVNLNFPSAYSYLKRGFLIGRLAWKPEDPTKPLSKFLKMDDGIVYIGTEGAWDIVESGKSAEGSLSVGDFLATDWMVPGVDVNLLRLFRQPLIMKP